MIYFEAKGIRLHHGDCLDVLREMAAESVDAVVTDPPAGIGFMNKAWDGDKGGRRQWIAWLAEVMVEVARVCKPGAHALVWALPRTSHWTATAIEDAGWEVRDVLVHLFGSGFPKSLNVSKAIETHRTLGGTSPAQLRARDGFAAVGGTNKHDHRTGRNDTRADVSGREVSDPEALRWEGWGTALKPGAENWILARKPLIGTVAANVLAHGTGALNIDGCRIASPDTTGKVWTRGGNQKGASLTINTSGVHEHIKANALGRWPANVLLDPDAAAELDRMSGTASASTLRDDWTENAHNGTRLQNSGTKHQFTIGDSGGAARFFLVIKEGRRCGSEKTEDVNTSAGRSTGSSADNCGIDGSGSNPTGQSRPDARSTTSTGTRSTILSPTSDASPLNGTTTTTGENEKIIARSAASNSDGASAAGNIERLICSTCGRPAPSVDTVSPAREMRSGNGATKTANTTTPTTENIDAPDFAPFRYVAKPSRAERDIGCEDLPRRTGGEATDRQDGTAGLDSPRAGAGRTGGQPEYRGADPQWVKVVLSQAAQMENQSQPQKDIGGSGVPNINGTSWSTCWCGSPSTDPCHPVIRSIIETATSSTTESKTSIWSTQPHTNGCMAAAISEMANGGSLASCAANPSPWMSRIGTSAAKDGPSTDAAGLATSVALWLTNDPVGAPGRSRGGPRNIHNTVKPVELMRWLVRLITPPGAVVLDPFLGSGTTAFAAWLEFRDFIGIEREAEYIAIAARRAKARAAQGHLFEHMRAEPEGLAAIVGAMPDLPEPCDKCGEALCDCAPAKDDRQISMFDEGTAA